jgi:curved DNA-binding protein CbpA
VPSQGEKTPYEVLGVARTATVDEIKKRYRELARKHHPDVNPNNPQAARLFADVTGAYKTLSDANSRATLDAELLLKERAAKPTGGTSAGTRTTGSAGAYRPTARSGSAPRPASPVSGGQGTANSASQSLHESERLSQQAQDSYNRYRFAEARSLAEQALRKNRRNALAYEVLGNVYNAQGRTDEALNYYTQALQLAPHNQSLRARFERAARSQTGPQVSGSSADRVFFNNRDNPTPPPRSPSAPSASRAPSNVNASGMEKASLALMLVGLFGYGAAFLLAFWAFVEPGVAPTGTPLLTVVSSWNAKIVTLLALCGALLGATMTITGVIRRIDDELILSGVGGRGVSYIPMGLLIIVLSVFNFYVAALVYIVLALLNESLTRTMQRVFGAVVVTVALLGLAYEPGHVQVLLWGGNVVFLTFVIGWLLGDFFRSDTAVS